MGPWVVRRQLTREKYEEKIAVRVLRGPRVETNEEKKNFDPVGTPKYGERVKKSSSIESCVMTYITFVQRKSNGLDC